MQRWKFKLYFETGAFAAGISVLGLIPSIFLGLATKDDVFTDQLRVKSAGVLWILSRIRPYCRNGFKLVSIVSNNAVSRIHLLYRELAATVPNTQIKKPSLSILNRLFSN